jgi:hypothetical protein
MLHLWSGSHLELRVLLEFHIHLQTHAFCSIVRQLQWLTELVPIEQQKLNKISKPIATIDLR